jgi:AbrB family looped-hinge helix DNA binding protein
MHITSKGQVTIPMAIRENMGFLPNTEIEFRVEKNRVYLEKIEKKMTRGEMLVERLRGKATLKMTTDEIMALTRGED